MHSLLKTMIPASICGGIFIKNHIIKPSYYKAYADSNEQVTSPIVKSLPSVNDLKNSFSKLNERDTALWRNKNINEILSGKFSNGYEDIVSNIRDIHVLNELSYITTMYSKPLAEHRKITLRNKMLEFYEKTSNEDEKRYFIHVLTYFEAM